MLHEMLLQLIKQIYSNETCRQGTLTKANPTPTVKVQDSDYNKIGSNLGMHRGADST